MGDHDPTPMAPIEMVEDCNEAIGLIWEKHDLFNGMVPLLEIIKGEINCPVCKNTLNYIIGLDKNVYGECETKDCLNWM